MSDSSVLTLPLIDLQTLTDLDLGVNHTGDSIAEYLGHGLRQNQVKSVTFAISLIHGCLSRSGSNKTESIVQ